MCSYCVLRVVFSSSLSFFSLSISVTLHLISYSISLVGTDHTACSSEPSRRMHRHYSRHQVEPAHQTVEVGSTTQTQFVLALVVRCERLTRVACSHIQSSLTFPVARRRHCRRCSWRNFAFIEQVLVDMLLKYSRALLCQLL